MDRIRLSPALAVLLIILTATGSGAACLGDLCACGRCDGGHQLATVESVPSCHGGEASASSETGCVCLDADNGNATPAATLTQNPEEPSGFDSPAPLFGDPQAPTPVETDIDLRSQPPSPARLFSLNSSMLL